MEYFIVFITVAIAVWYLCRRFKGAFNPNEAECGCNGCSVGNCGSSKDTSIQFMQPNQKRPDTENGCVNRADRKNSELGEG